MNLWQTIHLSSYLLAELKQVINPVLQRNGFFVHRKNILVATITDECKHVGMQRILKTSVQKVSRVKRITVPELNYDCSDYIDLISWHHTYIR